VQKAYDSNVLSKEVHGRHFVENLERFAKAANIPVGMIVKPMSEFCDDKEIEFITKLRTRVDKGVYGFCYVGDHLTDPPVPTRMMAMAAACMRNFLDVKVRTIDNAISGDTDPPTVLFIPDFCMAESSIATWDIPKVFSLLIDRQAQGLITIVSCPSHDMLKKLYGQAIAKHIANYFTYVQV